MELTKGQTLKYFIGLCIPHSYSCRFELSKELFLQFEIGTFELQILWKCHLHFSREKGRGLGLYTGWFHDPLNGLEKFHSPKNWPKPFPGPQIWPKKCSSYNRPLKSVQIFFRVLFVTPITAELNFIPLP